MSNNIRNITIIAHVDHGKTTLIDNLMKQTRIVGDNPQSTIEQFDYTCCAVAVDKNKKFTYHKDYFNHLESKELHYIGNHPNKFYLNKAKRLLRLLDKGFTLDQENMEKWLNTLIKDHKKPKRKY